MTERKKKPKKVGWNSKAIITRVAIGQHFNNFFTLPLHLEKNADCLSQKFFRRITICSSATVSCWKMFSEILFLDQLVSSFQL